MINIYYKLRDSTSKNNYFNKKNQDIKFSILQCRYNNGDKFPPLAIAMTAMAKEDPKRIRRRKVFLSISAFIFFVADFHSWISAESLPDSKSSAQYLSTSSTTALHPHSFRISSPTFFALAAMTGSSATTSIAVDRSFVAFAENRIQLLMFGQQMNCHIGPQRQG